MACAFRRKKTASTTERNTSHDYFLTMSLTRNAFWRARTHVRYSPAPAPSQMPWTVLFVVLFVRVKINAAASHKHFTWTCHIQLDNSSDFIFLVGRSHARDGGNSGSPRHDDAQQSWSWHPKIAREHTDHKRIHAPTQPRNFKIKSRMSRLFNVDKQKWK